MSRRNVTRRILVLLTVALISCGISAVVTPVSNASHTNQYICGHWVVGLIKHRYDEVSGTLGCPTSDELTNSGNTGKRQHFGPRGNIYWKTGDGYAYTIWGKIWDYWAASGYETSVFHYPSTNEAWSPEFGHYYQWFDTGCWLLAWNPTTTGYGTAYIGV